MGAAPITWLNNQLTQLGIGSVGQGAILSLSIRITMIALSFAQAIFLARLLGVEQYGVFSIVLSATSLIATFALIGLGEFSIREVSRLKANREFAEIKRFILWSGAAVAVAAVLGGLAVAAYTRFIEPHSYSEFRWALLIAPAMALLVLLRGICQGFAKVFYATAPTELIRPGIMVFALGGALLSGVNLSADMGLGLLATANLFALASAIYYLTKANNNWYPATSCSLHFRRWIRAALPFLILTILATAQIELNTLVLGWLSNAEQAGLFQPLLKFSPVMVLAVYAINVPLAPRISELWEYGNISKLRETVWTAVKVSTALVAASCVFLLTISKFILSAFGPEFVALGPALFWLAGAQVISTACGSAIVILKMTGNQGACVKSIFGGLAINLVLSCYLAPIYGAFGAVIALSAGICFSSVLMLLAVRRILGFDCSIFGAIAKS